MRKLCCSAVLAITPALLAQTLNVEPNANPAASGSSQVNLSVVQDGSPLLSWVESGKDGTSTLRYAIRRGAAWSEPRTIAANRHVFHHPAELPEVIALKGGNLLAHWIENPDPAGETEFIYVSASRDGVKWNTPVMAHHDRSQVQHGLASMVASGDREASIFWLQALKGPEGPTSLMRTVVGADGAEIKEETLDADACECCPTSAVRTARGLLVAYRDHTQDDIRDISVTRLDGGRWTSPKNVFADKWQIDACPVNAASVSAAGDQVVIAWYTASGDKPRVEMAFSNDGGATFTKAATISTGQAYGYASVAPDGMGGAYVSWLERGGDAGRVLVRHVSDSGAAGPVAQVAEGSRQSLGYPRLLRAGSDVWIAWNSAAKVQTARLLTGGAK